jgi:phosphoribosyl 1,2-cyclic phosphodiesterase
MRIVVWGARGSLPTPGHETLRYGGNTSCVQVTLEDGNVLVLDAGSGIRRLGLSLKRTYGGTINILLTHLHLDHIQGLIFFAPMFWPEAEIVIWGPGTSAGSLRAGIKRYLSAPLTPLDVRRLPSSISFREVGAGEWQVGDAQIRTDWVSHCGPTLGYRISEGDTSLCFIPDHEPALAVSLDDIEDASISGLELARGAGLLIHDSQYTDEQYPHRIGWGHASLSQTLQFARRAGVHELLLFHHDPEHTDDFLDRFADVVAERWQELGGRADAVGLAMERDERHLAPRVPRAASAG